MNEHTLEDELKQIRRRKASSNRRKPQAADTLNYILVIGACILAVILTAIAIAQTINHFYK